MAVDTRNQAKPAAPGGLLSRFSLKTQDALFGYLFIAPQTLGYLLVVLAPLIAVMIFSTQDRNLLSGQVTSVGMANYKRMVEQDPFFETVLRNSLIFAAGLVPLNVIMALSLAVMLTQKLRGVVFFRTLFFAPVVTSAVAWAVVWRFLLQENAGVNDALRLVGITGPNWLRDPNWAMFSVIFTRVLKGVGLNMVIFMAALQNIPQDYDDAAKVDGANLLQRVRHITVPLLSPTILLVVLLTVIGSLKVFDHILLMTKGGPGNSTNVLVYYIYFQAFKVFQTGYASALAMVLFGLTLVFTIVQWAFRRRLVYNEN
jgi:multiple sugar transport system permease protein